MRLNRDRRLLVIGAALVVTGVIGLVVTGALFMSVRPDRFGDARLRDLTRPFDDRPQTREGWRDWRRGPGEFETNGERIFFTGVGRDGRIPIEWDPPTGTFMPRPDAGPDEAPIGCAMCHGADGRGGRMGGMRMRVIRAPDIRYETLTSEHTEDGETEPAWDDTDIARAVREGVQPDGEELDPVMPRWDMSERDMGDLIGFLRGLD